MINKPKNIKFATFAGGCFWCLEPVMRGLDGIIDVKVGYANCETKNPSYEKVIAGTSGCFEAIQIKYDPEKITYTLLVDIFWGQIDPTDEGGQFADRGKQYRTAIFYTSEEQKKLAEESKEKLQGSGKFNEPIATVILPLKNFHPAEDYHQQYYLKNPERYEAYHIGSGRGAFVKGQIAQTCAACGSANIPEKEKLEEKLTPMQYKVTRRCGTESAFANEYWSNKREGIYVDIVTGRPLFSSRDKFDSGTGWPSFTGPIAADAVVETPDASFGMERVEVKAKESGSHLGHVFNDGPKPAGRRYCINSASLRFIPKKDLDKEGYGEYKKLFEI